MSNLPVVYSENDRHQLLLQLARKVTEQVAKNPNPHEYHDPEDGHIAPPHGMGRSK